MSENIKIEYKRSFNIEFKIPGNRELFIGMRLMEIELDDASLLAVQKALSQMKDKIEKSGILEQIASAKDSEVLKTEYVSFVSTRNIEEGSVHICAYVQGIVDVDLHKKLKDELFEFAEEMYGLLPAQ